MDRAVVVSGDRFWGSVSGDSQVPKDMPGVMKEFGGGQLHSGSKSGPVVTNRKQAIAIGLSEQKKLGGGSAGAYSKGRPLGGKR